jgi:hypothetical protein
MCPFSDPGWASGPVMPEMKSRLLDWEMIAGERKGTWGESSLD